ncbi:MAG TPA: carboxypeptidase regulatory-like domain-containing protein, partial [Candidatus Acidoferrales bacterium]|nr:carboxypeptidase regulatory-like domain-containing protein [Candidatus Acidoferrales bacterium]
MKRVAINRIRATFAVLAIALLCVLAARAATSGSIFGTVKDPSGAVLPDVALTLKNVALGTEYKAKTDARGYYSFPNLPVGNYDLTLDLAPFKTERRSAISVDMDSALQIDVSMQLAEESQSVTVNSTVAAEQVQVETVATHLGEVVSSPQMTALPLNGRSYTDLLAIQPGVSPVTTLTPTSVIMAGVTGTINPSGDLNPGDVSIDGQRESANGFMVDGIDVQEHMNGGTSVIPNLDSIDEFRVLTNNFDPEYGNYNGGMINVVTKSGSDSFHGDVFEFLRNTDLDAKNYFAATRGTFRQNQFGGTLGGPVKRQKVFFFADYQGTRTNEGITSPQTAVPSIQDRGGNLSDLASSFVTTTTVMENGQPVSVTVPTTVNGNYLATQVLSPQLGYAVSAGEPYYFTAGEHEASNPSATYPSTCSSTSQCVLSTLSIPQSAWSAPAIHLLQYIPQPNIGTDLFSTSAFSETVRDDKLSGRIDANTRVGQFAGYYFLDNYRLDNPYPGGQGGASVPGFDALTIGQAQLFSLGYTRLIGANTVNELHVGVLRNSNDIGEPRGGLGPSLVSQGFATPAGTPSITVQAPQIEGVENIVFPSFIMGVPITNTNQWNNTLYLGDNLSKVVGTHTLKFGVDFHVDQVNEHPNATFNGTFNILGTQTGSAFADFLLGLPSNFTQSAGRPFYLRNRYTGLFAEDSWHARNDLNFNFGVRWDLIMPWWEKYNNLQTVVPDEQSVLYPNAPQGLVVPGDPGIPSTISPSKYHNFAPRIGLAYSPKFDRGLLRLVFGDGAKSSLRASYGIFYTAFPGLSAGIMYAVPPFGYNYLSPGPPIFATPFVNASDGTANTNPFPLAFPLRTASDWAAATPISADPYFYDRNDVPYTENYMLSYQRQITSSVLVTISYAGNQGHHILALVPTNVGNPALCLSLSQPSEVAPGTATCGPYGEDAAYTSALGQVYTGTRNVGLGSNPALYGNYGAMTSQETIANSNYNALETNLRYSGKRTTVLLAYTYAKSIDQGSNLGEQLNPFDPALSRAISSWDMRHNFVATYKYTIPFDRLFDRSNRLTRGWEISGTTRFSSGFPVTLFDDSDNSLLGTLGNGVNNQLLDTPEFTTGLLKINTNPRNGQPEFDTALFSTESLGQLGNARRRFFYGPGINNFDLQVTKNVRITETKSLDIRVEGFNIFNHAQFYGPASVDGEVNDSTFGHVVSAADPR